MNFQGLIIFLFMAGIILTSGNSFAFNTINFGPKETRIDGSIPYSVIGKYRAHFKSFHGTIILGNDPHSIRSVYLEIKIASITSNCPICDRVVCSHKLMNATKYPDIIFKSETIIHDRNGFKVRGILQMHGIARRMTFPFNVETIVDQKDDKRILDIGGSWTIDRKVFDIVWNRILDHGGVLVGDDITVNWGIKSEVNK